MRKQQLTRLIEDLGDFHQVFRIIQLDRRSGVAHIPDAIIQWSATVELIVKGSNTKISELPIS